MYSTMQSLVSFALVLGVVFSLALTANGSSPRISNPPRTSSLTSRQAPGVVPTSEFLRRGGHSSVLVGDWVYIDGGDFSYKSGGTTYFQSSSTLLSIDLSETWSNSSVVIHSTSKPNGLPSLMYPSLSYDEHEDILYSGISGWVSPFANLSSPPPLSLWSFKPDGTGSGSWKEVIDSGSPVWDSITRPGSPMTAFGSDSAYVLGGFENSGTTLSAAPRGPRVAIPGLIQFNMTTKKFSNSTAGGYSFNGTGRTGEMHYVPSFGPEGLFVVMGGDDFWHPDDPVESLRDLKTISIYDPSSEQWFNQTTTGDIPQPRMEFCLAGVNSSNGTYEILMYAGWGRRLGTAAIPFDEIYILTLPAFHWIKVDYTALHPRHGLTCNAVGGSQVLTIGGLDTNSKDDTYSSPYNTTADPFAQGLAIFDMTTLRFADRFTANAPPYVQSDSIKTYYDTRPAMEFNSSKLAQLFNATYFANATSPSRPTQQSSSNTSHKTPVRDIAGGVAGGVALLVLLGALAFFVQKRRRSRRLEHVPYSEASGEFKRRQGQGPQEMYQMAPEMEGDPQHSRVAELRGESVLSPVELRAGAEVVELSGSAH